MTDKKMTPMLRQYRQLKRQVPDALLFYRLGDFYELFEDDAKAAARELGLVLTSRRFSKTVRLPMCGVPYRTATGYVARLLKGGYKVAIAEQMEDARRTKGLVKREVVRIITPGTVVEEDLLPDGVQNFLAAVVVKEVDGETGGLGIGAPSQATDPPCTDLPAFGLAVVDLSTGEFACTEGSGWVALADELHRLRPSELVLPASQAGDEGWAARVRAGASGGQRSLRLSPVPDAIATPAAARARLMAHFGVASLEGGGADGKSLALAAAGVALYYLQQNQPSDGPAEGAGHSLAHLRTLVTYSLSDYVGLDATTRRNLELTRTLREGRVEGSLLRVLDHTETAMGARLLRRWIQQPLLDVARIRARLDAVGELTSTRAEENTPGTPPFLRADLCKLLDGVYDVERLVGRIGFGSANARDLVALRRSLVRVPQIKALLAQATSERLCALDAELDELADVTELIGQALVENPPILIREGGLIRSGYHAGLDTLRSTAAQGRDWLSGFEAAERQRLDIPNLRVKYNQVFGFFVEVTKSHLGKVPPEYERRATVRSAERFVTPELKAREAEILAAEDRASDLEYDLFVELRGQVAAESDRLLAAARVLAELDVLSALAEVATRYGYVRPEVDDGQGIDIREGRHPVVERTLPGSDPFVPNDTCLNPDERLLIITGPNMAGKSVLVRQVALIVLLAQIGSFVPARSARIGLADRIFVRVGATDDIAQGRSTFLVEMSETAHILAHATSRSLVILDEVGRGTSTYDGMSLAWAVACDLHDRVGARTLFATHYHEMIDLEAHLPHARNYNLAVVEGHGDGSSDRVIFLRRLVPGGADRSYGLYVARLAGLPDSVVGQAKEVMARWEQGSRALRGEQERSGESEPESVGDEDLWAEEQRGERGVQVVREVGDGLLLPASDEAVWSVVRELYRLDIANMTPVQALVTLNDWQGRLKA